MFAILVMAVALSAVGAAPILSNNNDGASSGGEFVRQTRHIGGFGGAGIVGGGIVGGGIAGGQTITAVPLVSTVPVITTVPVVTSISTLQTVPSYGYGYGSGYGGGFGQSYGNGFGYNGLGGLAGAGGVGFAKFHVKAFGIGGGFLG